MKRASLFGLLLLSACASFPRPRLEARPADSTALAAAAERFYSATSAVELADAVAAARAAGPESALFHELAARLAQLEGHEDQASGHLVAALTDLGDDAALLHLHTLMNLELSWENRPRVEALLESLVANHPSVDVRALAAHHLAALLNQEGRFGAREEALASIPSRLSFAVVGTWDNDQGKGYDSELEPERRSGLLEKYEGRAGPLTWRTSPPEDPRGRLDLSALMVPTRWAVAYAQARVVAPADGDYALRLFTTDPLKVFVDGQLTFASTQVERGAWDALVVPVRLTQGPHQVLVKSAHKEGGWWLAGRLSALEAARGGPSTQPVLSGAEGLGPSGGRLGVEDIARWHVRSLPAESSRARSHLAAWAHLVAGGAASVRVADGWVHQEPKSVLARLSLIDALWYNQERGRTADALQALDATVGDELALVRLRQLRFMEQQGLKPKARARLLELTKKDPSLKDAWSQLAELHRAEGWVEDELEAYHALRVHCPIDEDDDVDLARALLRHGKRRQAMAVYEGILARLPASGLALRPLAELELDAGNLSAAERFFERRLAAWPTDFGAYLQLAEVKRRKGDDAGARAALDAASALSPEAPTPFARRGELDYAAGDPARALVAWRRALDLNPENDGLANRIDFLAPEARGPWMADLPDDLAIERAVKAREGLKPLPGADVAWLLDHEVTLLNSDGSTSNVVTLVVQAFNAQGRDRIIRQSIPSGRLRVLHAYSIDEKGQRSEASSERNRQIFFRAMQPGSTLVLQFRLDVPPKGFLARYFSESWSFQGTSDQRVESTYVLWAPLGTVLHERRVGEMERVEEKRGEQLRFSWSKKAVAPVLAEPMMPTLREVAANVSLSSVPDWKTWLSWEQALLDGVFRDSPEVDLVAKRLAEGAETPAEKLLRVHQFVMEEIRYQQDYETFIAGVKPHAAPVVLERRYGDCKDKAVLFITLAKKLGLEAQFALVRTRDVGPVNVDVPSQQFNHAIVWVPEQPGVETARFFDPTADLLDLDAVRSDDVGTQSLVFDPKTGQHTWREIAFQPLATNGETNTLALTLEPSGAAKGTLRAEGRGRTGSSYRQLARNSETLTQVFQRTIGLVVPGAVVSNVTAAQVDLRHPAAIELEVSATSFARPEGDALRVKLPFDANPRRYFALQKRKHPLVLGTPTQSDAAIALTLPEGLEARRLPQAGKVELPCLSFERTVSAEGRVVRSSQRFAVRCERLSAAEYPRYREAADQMARLLDDELVIGAVEKKAVKPTGKPAAAPKTK